MRGAKSKDHWKSGDSGNFYNSAQEKVLPTSREDSLWKSETLTREKVEHVETAEFADARRVAHVSHPAVWMEMQAGNSLG